MSTDAGVRSTLPLQQPGVTRRDAHAGSHQPRLYFTPDLPGDVILQERNSAHELTAHYKRGEVERRNGIHTA